MPCTCSNTTWPRAGCRRTRRTPRPPRAPDGSTWPAVRPDVRSALSSALREPAPPSTEHAAVLPTAPRSGRFRALTGSARDRPSSLREARQPFLEDAAEVGGRAELAEHPDRADRHPVDEQ